MAPLTSPEGAVMDDPLKESFSKQIYANREFIERTNKEVE